MYKYIGRHLFSMDEIDRRSAAAFGKSLYVPLPSALCRVMDISKGTVFKLYRDGNKIIYEKLVMEKPVWPVVKPK